MTREDSAHDRVWLGIDLGTQGARALAVSAGGQVVGSGQRPLVGTRAGDRHEQDPEYWWRAMTGACRDALESLDQGRIRGVATDSTSGTILLLDGEGTAITPGLMYDDARAVDQARRANEVGEALWGSLGYRMQPTWALPKLLWLLEHRSELIAGARLSHQCDYVNRRLVGSEVAADSSHALKTGYDLIGEAWPETVLDRLGVPEGLLPPVVRSGSVLGEVGHEGAEETGVPAGTPLIAGMTDGCAAQIAAGALAEGSWSSVLGTTLALKGASSKLIRDPNGVLYCHRSPDGGWLPGGASSVGAGILSATFPGADLDELGDRASQHEQTEVLAYPLASPGERFPFYAPEAEGFMLGRPREDGERFAALLQGLAFVERLCLDYMDLLGAPADGELSLTGGATRGRYFTQLRADVLGRPLRLVENADPAAGMAVLAAAHERRLADVAHEMVRMREVIEPRESRSGWFAERYVRLVGELEGRGWLDPAVADHARGRASR